jgi:outer membrane biosynthesis protein TonB
LSIQPLKRDPGSETYSIRSEAFILHMHWNALRILGIHAQEGFHSLPRRGLEVGGLLLGSAEGRDVRLCDVHAIAIEHKFGPSYQLSDADVKVFRETIEGLQQSSGVRVIGHFRSHTKGKLELMFADLTIAALTGAPQPLVLLVTTSADEPAVAHLYRKTGDKFTRLLAFRLPSEPGAQAVISGVQFARESVSEPPPNEVAEVPDQAPRADRPNQSKTRPWRTALAACIIVGAILGGYSAWRALHRQHSTDTSSVQLTVQQTADSVSLSWDRTSTAVRSASSGVLTIQDGSYGRIIRLTRSELTMGRVFYSPQTDAIRFRLDLYQGGDTVSSDSAVAIAIRPPPSVVARRDSGVTLDVPVSRTGAASRVSEKLAPKPAAPRRRFQPLPQASPLFSAEIGVPPEIPAQIGAASPAPVLPRNPDPLLPAPLRSAESSTAAISFVAAIPVKKVTPALPPRLRSLIHESVSIEVAVRIDVGGKVIEAKAIRATSTSQKLLSADAVQAAMLWRFEPARKNGNPVASETVLKFDFGRGSY